TMRAKLIHKSLIVIAAILFLFIVFASFRFVSNVPNPNPKDFTHTSLIYRVLKQAKSLEVEYEQQYQLTAVVINWKRLSSIQLAVQRYLNATHFRRIIVWNNNPAINLTYKQILPQNQSFDLIRIINSKKNLKDEAKYRACAEAETLACFYVDDDWDISHYMNTLIASFRSDPNVLHSVTNYVTYYNNMLWTFMDSRIELHVGFSWIGCGSVFLREHARRHLQLLEVNLENNSDLFAFSDLFFSIWLNDIPSQMVVNLLSLAATANETNASFSSTNNFYSSQHKSSVLAIRKLEAALRLNKPTMNITFPRKQNRRFSYCTKSPSPKDDFTFYSNVLPIDIEHIPFDIKVDSDRGTYRYVPNGPNYTHFIEYNTLKAVDNDEKHVGDHLDL
ncbi:unnamed protein product, partial [Rotaria magnacalcarata]